MASLGLHGELGDAIEFEVSFSIANGSFCSFHTPSQVARYTCGERLVDTVVWLLPLSLGSSAELCVTQSDTM